MSRVMRAESLTAVVTGAAGGLGQALVRRLLAGGATVFAVDRSFGAAPIADEHRIEVDLGEPAGVSIVVDALGRSVPAIDLLVNAAGLFIRDTTDDRAWDDIDLLVRTNLTSMVVLTLRLEALLVRARSPSVVNIGSTDGVVASSGQDCEVGVAHDVFYAMSKGAVITFSRALAMKWAPVGIRVNVVCPTIFDSPMTESLLEEDGKIEHLSRYIPMGRLGTAADVANAVIALHDLEFTTGHMLPVDGGYLCQ